MLLHVVALAAILVLCPMPGQAEPYRPPEYYPFASVGAVAGYDRWAGKAEYGGEASLLHVRLGEGPPKTHHPFATGLGIAAGITSAHAYVEAEGAVSLLGVSGGEAAPLITVVGGIGPGWWWGGDTSLAGVQATLSLSLLIVPLYGYVRTEWAPDRSITIQGGLMLKVGFPLPELPRPTNGSR